MNKALIGFGGFGGPEIAMHEVGIETVSIEMDSAIAEVSRYNGNNVITANLLDMDPSDFLGWLLYHFSPPCPSFSVANHASSESGLDIALARKICEFIRLGRPEYFTLENVWMYRKSLSWLLIWYTLLEEGYGIDAWNLNSADYGVPQSRKRMIVIARRDGREPVKPWPTHAKQPDMFTKPWRGWYGAIEDLIPGLPETKPAQWQMDRMPEELRGTCLVNNNTGSADKLIVRDENSPSFTVVSSLGAKGAMPRAFLLASANTSSNNGKGTIRSEDKPMFTVLANGGEKNAPPKAFVIDCQRNSGKDGLTIRQSGEPIFTMTASANRTTIRAGLASGRWVSMSTRCLARFQDFPDWYIFPGEPGLYDNPVILAHKRSGRELACRGIGNALPMGVYRAVLGSLI